MTKKAAPKKAAPKKAAPKKTATKKTATKKTATKLLTGGNPQIAKGDGDDVVAAYIAALPSWKRDIGAALDAAIVATVPKVRKAVRWNSPFYGVDGDGWFLGFHALTKYIKINFFRGTSLTPMPPEGSASPEIRYLHLFEGDAVDAQLRDWLKQAAALPGAKPF